MIDKLECMIASAREQYFVALPKLAMSVSPLCRGQRSFDPRDIAAEVLKAKLYLVLVKPLGPPAKLATLQLLDDEMKPFDLGLCCAEGGALS